jgi:hypothetical protein
MKTRGGIALALPLVFLLPFPALAANPLVEIRRVSDRGLEPTAAVDASGVIHLVYFTGDPRHGDLWYARGDAKPIRVNGQAKSAVVLGGVRGPHLALGKNGDRVHVLWNGSDQATPRSPGGGPPLLYARSNPDGTAFDAERNLLTTSEGLDGGAAIAASEDDRLYFAWHGQPVGMKDASEATRRVWLATSLDGGATISKEAEVDKLRRGVCACCGLGLAIDVNHSPLVLYRTAERMVHRDMVLLRLHDPLEPRTLSRLDIGKCVMSTSASAGSWITWEDSSAGRIAYGNLNSTVPIRSIGEANPKHPAIAVNELGYFVIAWTEKTSWDKGGSLAWQLFDPQGDVVQGAAGRADDLPAWDTPAAVALRDRGFVLFY